MRNEDFSTTITVAATPAEVFQAISHVRGWWSENVSGHTDRANGEFTYHYQDVHRAKMQITTFKPDQRMVWHVIDNYFKFTTDETEWTGTNIIFDISKQDDRTVLRFTHEGLVPAFECFQICHDAWTHYIQDSLKNLIETGKGSPTPLDTADPEPATPAGHTGSAKSICHRLLIGVPVEKVFAALSTQDGLAGWWTPDTMAKPQVGSIARFVFDDYFKEMEVVELKPYSKVKWHCLQAYHEWIGTTVTFETVPHQQGAILLFRHEGWKDYSDEFASCSYAWALFLGSLKALCETGTGTPYPAIG
ncbi:SRPBCC domain-containing protein [Pedobacter yulinensis]|uniref:SRPBCC domain-containing protein n=1 Tax=Pedobacter yulinensis TaxID=2126353 RepID=A0A2T3HL13_9SPHI|nr:SRPBCC domain-containing protein [Pedobacter yulinensis]PST83116.1 SRPBCC domain-containing protein [Pedobacter yulinensis]